MPQTLPYGYRWFNGVVFCDLHTDLYNRLLDEAAGYKLAGFDRAADESHKERRNLLHTLFEFYLEETSTPSR